MNDDTDYIHPEPTDRDCMHRDFYSKDEKKPDLTEWLFSKVILFSFLALILSTVAAIITWTWKMVL